ncbi:MAG: ATP-binding protein [Dehalococcoidia bacterium]|nr:ATP-binding protein [Dehalococcoidia bacterium]
MPKCKVFVVDPDVRALSKLVPALADQGFEVAGAQSEPDLLGKMEAGAYDLVFSIMRDAAHNDSAPTALLLCRLKASATPIGIVCPLVPTVVSVDRQADLLRNASAQARELGAAAITREVLLLSELVRAMGQQHPAGEVPAPAIEVIARAISADQSSFLAADEKGALRLVHSYSSNAKSMALLKGLADIAARERRVALATTVETAPQEVRSEMAAQEVRSALAMPVLVEGRLTGVISALVQKPDRVFGAGQQQTASLLVNLISTLLENESLSQKERTSKDQLAESLSVLEQRQREIKALNALLQGQYSRMKALEEQSQIHQEQYLAAVRLLVSLVESTGALPRGQAESVATWTVALARGMNLPVEGLAEAAYLHDIGKAPVAKEMALKWKQAGQGTVTAPVIPPLPGETKAEDVGREHPVGGEEVARMLKLTPAIGQAIRHHHENYDGTGYPDGLSGTMIPIGARLIKVTDAHVTITTLAPTDAGDARKTIEHLKAGRGKLFDPVITDVFIKMLQKHELPTESEMISTVSHELRSPLTYLVGYSELLASTQDLPESAQRAAKEIYSEAQHMTRIVEDMLDLSRIESGQAKMNLKGLEPGPLIERSVSRARLKSATHQVEAQLPASLPRVRADSDRLQQVLDNLLDNAIKYSPDGGKVVVKAEPQRGELLVTVSDQGIGIPKDKLEVVFDKFQRLDTPLKHKVSGTGIGLNLCRRIVEAHGGRIWAESDGSRGTVISFTTPLESDAKSTAS